ncbi:MAG: hypothetical protein GF418_12560 [Chitinivibrionales bacterium]|nr:hypothetical protein [Chitinivibrionales bacterium]MBD3396451.1 hypothetical protein [Chitinivibrionales bacterium]
MRWQLSGALRAKLRDTLLDQFPSMRAMISGRNTAIVAPNQWLAVNYAMWLRAVGLTIPQDISIVGFDNFLLLRPTSVSTVVMALADVGYASAHIFLGDVPVKTDRWGNVYRPPTFLDRGSIGPPRRSHRRLV